MKYVLCRYLPPDQWAEACACVCVCMHRSMCVWRERTSSGVVLQAPSILFLESGAYGLNTNGSHGLIYLSCLVIMERHYLKRIRRCGLIGVGVSLMEEVRHCGAGGGGGLALSFQKPKPGSVLLKFLLDASPLDTCSFEPKVTVSWGPPSPAVPLPNLLHPSLFSLKCKCLDGL